MKKFKNCFPYIFSIFIIYFIFITIFYIVLYHDKNFLINLFNKFDVYKNLPFKLSSEDIHNIATELMDFLIGKRAFLDTKIHINGQLTELYSLTAKIHMADVRNIFILNLNFRYIALSIAMLFLILSTKLDNPIQKIFIAYRNTLIFLLAIILIIVIYAIIDFNSFFMLFHKLIFTNEYYLFDPSVDYIILMLPERLFAYIGIKVIAYFVLTLGLLLLALYLFSKIQHRPEAK